MEHTGAWGIQVHVVYSYMGYTTTWGIFACNKLSDIHTVYALIIMPVVSQQA